MEHIPLDEYEFDEDVPASEIREVDGQELDSDEEESSDEEDEDEDEEDDVVKAEVIETGRWRNKKTGKLLGAGGEEITFTVTGQVVFLKLKPAWILMWLTFVTVFKSRTRCSR